MPIVSYKDKNGNTKRIWIGTKPSTTQGMVGFVPTGNKRPDPPGPGLEWNRTDLGWELRPNEYNKGGSSQTLPISFGNVNIGGPANNSLGTVNLGGSSANSGFQFAEANPTTYGMGTADPLPNDPYYTSQGLKYVGDPGLVGGYSAPNAPAMPSLPTFNQPMSGGSGGVNKGPFAGMSDGGGGNTGGGNTGGGNTGGGNTGGGNTGGGNTGGGNTGGTIPGLTAPTSMSLPWNNPNSWMNQSGQSLPPGVGQVANQNLGGIGGSNPYGALFSYGYAGLPMLPTPLMPNQGQPFQYGTIPALPQVRMGNNYNPILPSNNAEFQKELEALMKKYRN